MAIKPLMTDEEFYMIYRHIYYEASRLKEWREKRGYSAWWAARNAGLSIRDYKGMEEGLITPPLDVMRTLCQLLRITLADLSWCP